jgi:hypothetical protein
MHSISSTAGTEERYLLQHQLSATAGTWKIYSSTPAQRNPVQPQERLVIE